MRIERNIIKYGKLKRLHKWRLADDFQYSKTHLKWKALTFPCKYKNFIFQVNTKIFKQVQVLVLSSQLTKVFCFKIFRFYFVLWKCKKFFLWVETNFFVGIWLVRWPRLLQYRLLLFEIFAKGWSLFSTGMRIFYFLKKSSFISLVVTATSLITRNMEVSSAKSFGFDIRSLDI